MTEYGASWQGSPKWPKELSTTGAMMRLETEFSQGCMGGSGWGGVCSYLKEDFKDKISIALLSWKLK